MNAQDVMHTRRQRLVLGILRNLPPEALRRYVVRPAADSPPAPVERAPAA